MRSFIVALLILVSVVPAQAESNDKLKVFLTSCAYGTAGGALLGLASLAFANDPASSVTNVARGASLGLYAGIGVGLYLINSDPPPRQDLGSAYITPSWYQGRVDGAEVHYMAVQF